MCLAVPMRVVSVDGQDAIVEQSGVSRRARTDMVPDVLVGDYVLVHAGFAIAMVQEDEAMETLALMQELGDDAIY
jgi:hydrogenase expression/formation protein HypC